jgi:hypothetical protein
MTGLTRWESGGHIARGGAEATVAPAQTSQAVKERSNEVRFQLISRSRRRARGRDAEGIHRRGDVRPAKDCNVRSSSSTGRQRGRQQSCRQGTNQSSI